MGGSDATAIDMFCGMGGSSTGLVEAGWTVVCATNHWARAVETHSANHPDTEHLCADIQAIDLRRLPRARVLWASPICTEVSPAGGRARRDRQPGHFEQAGHVAAAAFERTRVTFWEVLRAAELWDYDAVLIENVVEAADWALFEVWLAGMSTLGYRHQFVSVNAAHVDVGGSAPQWRDRLYIVFTKEHMRQPDLQLRPEAFCPACERPVRADQFWKPTPSRAGAKHTGIGKYGQQYHYVCPEGHGRIEPFVRAAAEAIDWDDLGVRIGDRQQLGMRPPSPRTVERIRQGLAMVTSDLELVTTSTHGSGPAPFVTMLRNHNTAKPITDPLDTFSTARHHGLTVPPGAFIAKQYGGNLSHRDAVKPVTTPLPATVAHSAPTLIVPFRKGARPYPCQTAPISTVATREQHAVLHAEVDLQDCRFRMLKPRETATAQRFPSHYVILGHKGEQQQQAGNAVAVNVARWIGTRVRSVL